MTVLVLSKNKDTYYLHSDGRASMDWMGIASDNFTKIHFFDSYIVGICGNCSDVLPVLKLLEQTTIPFEVLKLGQTDEFRGLFTHFTAIVAHKKHGVYTIERSPHRDSSIESDLAARPGIAVTAYSDKDLPLVEGSGSLQVRALLSQYSTITPSLVKKSIEQGYKTNHTIGGHIIEVKLKV